MAKKVVSNKVRKGNSITRTTVKYNRNDVKMTKERNRHQERMERLQAHKMEVSDPNYQKHKTMRALGAGAEAAGGLASPATAAAVNATNAYGSGGFNLNIKSDSNGTEEDESNTSSSSVIWG